MSDNIKELGDLPLRYILLPGSHDAGMSVSVDNTPLGTREVTQTQTKSVLEQLRLGVRVFDIRPIMCNGEIKTGHYGKVDELGFLQSVADIFVTHAPNFTWQGANGQSLKEVLDNVNEFTSTSNELIVLQIAGWSLFNRDRDFKDFDDDDYHRLFSQLGSLSAPWNIIKFGLTEKYLPNMPLSQFISIPGGRGGRAAVVVTSQWRMDAKLPTEYCPWLYKREQWYNADDSNNESLGINVALSTTENISESTGLRNEHGHDILSKAAVANDEQIPKLEERVMENGQLKRHIVWADRIEDDRLWKKCLEISLKSVRNEKARRQQAFEAAEALFAK